MLMDFASSLIALFGFMIGAFFTLAILSLIGAVFLKWATRLAVHFSISYLLAYLTVFVALGVYFLIDQLLMFCFGFDRSSAYGFAILPPTMFIVGGLCFGRAVQHPVHGPVGLGKGLKISAWFTLMQLLLIGLIVLLMAG